MNGEIRDCPSCGVEREFTQHHPYPERCLDAADGQCPEWLCTTCGVGLLIEPLAASAGRGTVHPRRAAGQLDRVA